MLLNYFHNKCSFKKYAKAYFLTAETKRAIIFILYYYSPPCGSQCCRTLADAVLMAV